MSLSRRQLHGVWVAMVTPWDEVQAAPRRDALARLVDRFAQAGVDGLFILGTTGEGTLLSPEERKVFAEATMEAAEGKLPIIVHTGHDRTSIAVELALHAKAAGAAAVAVSAPARYRLDESELETHFLLIAQALGDFPMLLYDIPCATGNPLSVGLLIRISEQAPNVMGAKVSRSDWEAWEGYLALAESMALFVGTDTMCLPALEIGASGIVSGPANLLPELYVQVYRAVRGGDIAQAKACQDLVRRLCQAVHYGTPLAFIKEGLEVLGWAVGPTLSPLRPLRPTERAELRQALTQLSEAATTGGARR
ncbi:dihydrodipicolinate synthase family protein [Candidatus Bipolaricaulota bacterium]|nr:dihydrodipicolinate synthase family protein [Candidatus Bipolaricaulota bacterium]